MSYNIPLHKKIFHMIKIINNSIDACHLLKNKDVVAIPTETVYGLAADASCLSAIKKVFQLKNRPLERTLALNIYPEWSIEQWCQNIPDYVYKLIEQFWPGPLTIVLTAKPNVVLPQLLGSNHSIALRCPAHPKTLELLKCFGKPIVAPSANPSDRFSATNAKQVAELFKSSDLTILDGGDCALGVESTIVKADNPKQCQILRYGAISPVELETCLGFKPIAKNTSSSNTLYQPFYVFENPEQLKLIIETYPSIQYTLIATPSTLAQFAADCSLSLSLDVSKAQTELYQIFNQALSTIPNIIFIEKPNTDQDQWRAICQQIDKFSKPIAQFTNH
jgi:L-threonylcarbamoyladenylate synthase